MSRRQLLRYKGNKCAHCGRSVEQMLEDFGTINRCFHFHHIDPGKKDPNYDKLIRLKLSTQQLNEVDKCVLLCSLCHGIVEGQSIPRQFEIEISVSGKAFSQEFTGQLLRNFPKRTASLLTSDPILVWPYWLHPSAKKKKLINGQELANGLLTDLMKNIFAKHKAITIRAYYGEWLLGINRLSADKAKMEFDVRAPFMSSELYGDDDQVEIWIRRGYGLVKDGEVFKNGKVTIEYYSNEFSN